MSGINTWSTRRVVYGTTLPATCQPGMVFTEAGGSADGLYVCLSANTWTLLDTSAHAGTVTSVSVVTANGFSGSVATATTTPAITINNPTALVATTSVTTPQVTLGTVSSVTGTLRLANASSANLTTIQAGNAAAARTYTWPTNFGSAGAALTDAAGNGTLSWVVPSSITNSAPANTVTKSNGTNLVASRITDDGTNIAIDSGAGSFTFGDISEADSGVVWTFQGTGNFTPNIPSPIGSGSVPLSAVVIGGEANHATSLTSAATTNKTVIIPDVVGTLTIIGASVALTAQSASIGATNIQVNGGVAPAGLYRLSYYLVITTAGTSGTVSATFGWSDLAAARTSGTGNITFGSLAAPATGSVIIQANGVANITYLTTVTAAVGSPAYALNITLERLQ